MRLDLELLDVIDDGGNIVGTGKRGGVDDAVKIVEILAIPLTLGGWKDVRGTGNTGGSKPGTVANAAILRIVNRVRAWSKGEQRGKASAVKRQIGNRTGFHHCSQISGGGLEQLGGSRNRDCLRFRTYSQLEVLR